MAKAPDDLAALAGRYGPNPSYAPQGGWEKASNTPPDRLVKTHCCFCGQQCGIQLKVRDNKVVGFEPWEEFPFNEGKLC
ncbi:MAG: nitrite reductase, partial [Vicinamibacteria bacterium]